MEPYKDPDEFMKNLGAEEFRKRIEKAENSFFFELRMMEREYDLKDPESNRKKTLWISGRSGTGKLFGSSGRKVPYRF